MKFLPLFTIINLLILAFILIIHKSTIKRARFYLAGLLLCLAVNTWEYYVLSNELYSQFLWSICLSSFSSSLIGPLFLFFVRSILGKSFKNKYSAWIHFIFPALILLNFIIFQWQEKENKICYVLEGMNNYPIKESLISALIAFQIFIYIIVSYSAVKEYQNCLNENLSYSQDFSFKWLSTFIVFVFVIFVLFSILIVFISNQKHIQWAGQITATVFYLFVFYKTITYPSIYLQYYKSSKLCDPIEKNGKTHVYKDIDFKTTFENVIKHMETQKPYLIPKLSIDDLSNQTGIKKHVLSQVINSQNNHNFYTLINTYRVEEAKKKLTDSSFSNLTIEAIGKECGFYTASNFFEVFKKFTKTTPSKYRKLHL